MESGETAQRIALLVLGAILMLCGLLLLIEAVFTPGDISKYVLGGVLFVLGVISRYYGNKGKSHVQKNQFYLADRGLNP